MPGETVLIADRDADTREILALALARAGFRPLVAEDGELAMLLLEDSPVQLVIADLYLPCGPERCLLRAIKRHPVHGGMPVIAYTARLSPIDFEWSHRQGYDLMLAKPTPILAITDHVRGLVDRRAANS